MWRDYLAKALLRFVELLEESTIIQGSVTLALILTIIYMSVMEMEIPGLLIDATMLILGFWFGSKSQQSTNATLKRIHGAFPATPIAKEIDDV